MRFFFRSRQFKMILIITAILLMVSLICGIIGGTMSPQSNIFGSIAAPFRSAATHIAESVSDFFTAIRDGEKLMIENAELETQMAEMREKLADYEKKTEENKFLKDFLGIKEANNDFKFETAILISRDIEDPYGGFVINKGTLDGVAAYDPVITADGLVGYISETGLTTSKVITILSTELTAGALDNRTNDSGIVTGTPELAQKGMTKLRNLSRSCNIAVGDYIVTSGEGVFPAGILIGSIDTIGSDKYNTSIYANVKPFADIENIRNVMVITDFKGQTGFVTGEGK